LKSDKLDKTRILFFSRSELLVQKLAHIKIFHYLCGGIIKTCCLMPKIFEYFGFIFFFYSNEHEPIHVHVMHNGCQSIFELIMMDGTLVEVRIREKAGEEPLSSKDKKTAEAFIRKYSKNIIQKWVKFFVMKQAVKSTNIKTKI
jgi:hypothetical protein